MTDAALTTSAASRAWSSGRRVFDVVGLGRNEATFAVGSLGVIGVHVVDDNFLQPQPGTSAADHLVSGLVPLTVLTVVAALYARARPGLRASLAAALGLFGVVTGIESSHVGGMNAQPKQYERRVVGFFDRTLLDAT